MNPLLAMQAMTLGRVLNEAQLATVNVLEERKGITDADMQQALGTVALRPGGKKGAAIVVGLPWFEVNEPNAPGPALMMTQQLRCIEKPGLNQSPIGTKISVEQLAVIVTRLMHLFRIAIPSITYVVKRGDQLTYDGGEREIVIEVRGKHDLPMLTKTQAPLIQGNSVDGLTLVAASGATVYFTTDGSYPCAGNPTAQLYGLPTLLAQSGAPLESQDGQLLEAQSVSVIQVAAGTFVQAVATLPNQQASDLAGTIVS